MPGAILLLSATLTHAQSENALGPFVSVHGGIFQPSSGDFAKSYRDAYRGGFGFGLGSRLSESIVTFGRLTRRVFPSTLSPLVPSELRMWVANIGLELLVLRFDEFVTGMSVGAEVAIAKEDIQLLHRTKKNDEYGVAGAFAGIVFSRGIDETPLEVVFDVHCSAATATPEKFVNVYRGITLQCELRCRF